MGLDAVEMIVAVEEEFGITIPAADAEKMGTPGHLIAYVQKTLGSNQEGSLHRNDEIRKRVRGIISDQLLLEDFKDTDEFGRDLGMD